MTKRLGAGEREAGNVALGPAHHGPEKAYFQYADYGSKTTVKRLLASTTATVAMHHGGFVKKDIGIGCEGPI